jgi:hypothetical protein
MNTNIFWDVTLSRCVFIYRRFVSIVKSQEIKQKLDFLTPQYGIVDFSRNIGYEIRGGIQNILDWGRHLYSSYGSAKHRYVVGLP